MRSTLYLITILACQCDGFGDIDLVDAATPFAPGACAADTTLNWSEPSPEQAGSTRAPEGVEAVFFPADPGQLRGWIMRPKGTEPAPVMVYLHAGFAWHNGLAEASRWLTEAGWIVFMPTVRGENGNPGVYQLLCGEVDDAAAAVKWIAQQDGVDPQRVAVFGHGAGGALSAMLSLYPDLPAAHTASAGGLYFEELLKGWGAMAPYPADDPVEMRRRLFVSHLGELHRPHHAWLGETDALQAVIEPAQARAAIVGAPLHIRRVPGDHRTSVDAALHAYVALIEASAQP
jgi:acetyl esterase/lipase